MSYPREEPHQAQQWLELLYGEMTFYVVLPASQIRETGAFAGGGGDLIDFKTALVELDEVRVGERLNCPQSPSQTRKANH